MFKLKITHWTRTHDTSIQHITLYIYFVIHIIISSSATFIYCYRYHEHCYCYRRRCHHYCYHRRRRRRYHFVWMCHTVDNTVSMVRAVHADAAHWIRWSVWRNCHRSVTNTSNRNGRHRWCNVLWMLLFRRDRQRQTVCTVFVFGCTFSMRQFLQQRKEIEEINFGSTHTHGVVWEAQLFHLYSFLYFFYICFNIIYE